MLFVVNYIRFITVIIITSYVEDNVVVVYSRSKMNGCN